MHYTKQDVQAAAKPVGDGAQSRTVLRLKAGDSAYEPNADEPIPGPLTLVYDFNPFGVRVEMLDPWPLPLGALRAVRGLRSLLRR